MHINTLYGREEGKKSGTGNLIGQHIVNYTYIKLFSMGDSFTFKFAAGGIELDAPTSLVGFALLQRAIIAKASPAVCSIHHIFTMRHTETGSSKVTHTTFKHCNNMREERPGKGRYRVLALLFHPVTSCYKFYIYFDVTVQGICIFANTHLLHHSLAGLKDLPQ